MSGITNVSLAVVGLAILLSVACAQESTSKQKNSTDRNRQDKSLATYSLKILGCPITFQNQTGGSVVLQSTDAKAGYYSHELFEKKANLSIAFDCVQQPAKEYCPTVALDEKEEDPSTWKIMSVTRYAPIHSRYGGEAFATNLTAVPLPRPRKLIFCLGDDRRSLVGSSMVGNERGDIATKVFEILKTVHFTDE